MAVRGEKTTRTPRQRGMGAALPLCFGLVLSHSISIANAEERDLSPDNEQRAIALYREGVALAREGRWKEAEELFKRVTAIRAAPPVLFALGRAQVENRKLATAKATFERALHNDDPQYAHVVEQAAEQLRLIAPRIPRLDLDYANDARDATVTVDGVPFGATRVVELDCCAPHEIVVSRPGHHPFSTTIQLEEGEERHLEPTLEPENVRKTPAVVPSHSTARRASGQPHETGKSIVGPLILGGAGVAAGIVGFVVRTTAQNSYDGALASCTGDPPLCSSENDVQAGNSARTRIEIGTITTAVGIAALTGAGVWWVLSGTPQRSRHVELGVTVGQQATIAGIRGAL